MRAPEKVLSTFRMRLTIKQETTKWWMKNARAWCVTCATCGVVSRRVPCREFASAALQRCSERAQGDASRPPASERLPPGPPRAPPAPRARHAPPAAALAGRTALPHYLTTSRSEPQRAHAPRDYRCVLWDVSRGAGGRREAAAGGGARHAPRGAAPARCVTHLSRRFLACSRSPPSAETCEPGAARRARHPHIATVLMPSAKLFALHPKSSTELSSYISAVRKLIIFTYNFSLNTKTTLVLIQID